MAKRLHQDHRTGRPVVAAFSLDFFLIFFVVVRSLTADSNLLQPTGGVNSTPHTSHFLAPACFHFNVTSTLTQVWRAAHISLHPIFMRSWCGCSDSLRFSLPLLAVYLLSYRPVHSPGLQLVLPWCGRQVPCALSLMRTLAPLPSTTLPQVMNPTTTTSRRLLNHTTRNPLARMGPEWPWVRWLHHRHSALFTTVHTGEREDAPSRWQAYHSPEEGLSSSQSSSVGHGTGRLVGDQFDSLISNVKENPFRSIENEQIRILLERQREQILADCQAEIQKTWISGRLWQKKYSKVEWSYRVSKRRNLSLSSRRRTTSTRSTTSSWTIIGTKSESS